MGKIDLHKIYQQETGAKTGSHPLYAWEYQQGFDAWAHKHLVQYMERDIVGCPVCRGETTVKHNISLWEIDKAELSVGSDEEPYCTHELNIGFCPFCGRKLMEEE